MNFRFLTIPVHIHPTFWILMLFFTGIYRDFSIESVIVGLVLFLSLIVHEYGHALTALYFGAQPTITLEGLGGKAQYNGARMTSQQQLWITIKDSKTTRNFNRRQDHQLKKILSTDI